MKHLYLSAISLMTLLATTTAMAQTYQYVKVTSEPADWCGTYLIVHENDAENNAEVFDGSLTDLDVAGNYFVAACDYKDINGTNVRVIESNTQTDAATWTVTKGEGDGIYYIQSASGFWIGYNSTTEPIDPNLKFADDKTYDNTIAMESGKTNVVVTAKNGFELRWNDDKTRFRYHESGKKKSIKFYAKTELSTSSIETLNAAPATTRRYTIDGRTATSAQGLSIEEGRLIFRK